MEREEEDGCALHVGVVAMLYSKGILQVSCVLTDFDTSAYHRAKVMAGGTILLTSPSSQPFHGRPTAGRDDR